VPIAASASFQASIAHRRADCQLQGLSVTTCWRGKPEWTLRLHAAGHRKVNVLAPRTGRPEPQLCLPAVSEPAAQGRQIFRDWLTSRIEENRSYAPSSLWHYTDASGLQGILSTQQLWATRVDFLNDALEFWYGVDLFVKALVAYNASGCKPPTRRFVDGLRDPDRFVIPSFLMRTASAFVTCFCADGDLLSQWRAYAGRDNVGGYALGFEPPGDIHAWPQAAAGSHELALRRVLYDCTEQKGECLALVDQLVAFLDTDPTDLEIQKSFSDSLIDGLIEIATWCKHPAFREENEWRITYIRSDDASPLPLDHRSSSGLVVPFVRLEVPRAVGAYDKSLPIAEIKCGPSPDPERKQAGVRSILTTLPDGGKIAVNGSSAPLRL
jgi:Protein of unknown function (DUF2971)